MKLDEGKLNVSLGAQFGSEGKALLNHYIAITNHIDVAISNASANAGHTFYYHRKKCVAKFLPVSGIVHTRNQIYLCGAIIHPESLLAELDKFEIDHNRVAIHPNCAIISDEDVVHERETSSSVTKIASTRSGVGHALIRKISRSASLARDTPGLAHMVCELDLHDYMDQGCTCLMEVPQGFGLSIDSPAYPYCTSRNITVSAAMNDAQVHPSYLGKVCIILRSFPIRVGNIIEAGIEIGHSGPFYPDSEETTWEDIGVKAELTTVTGRIRRVATFSKQQYDRALNILRPDYVMMNFANYLTKEGLAELLEDLPEVSHLGFGPTVDRVYLNNIT